MLTLHVDARELFDESKQEFITVPESTIHLEHSLVAISKWEAKWCKPFLGKKEHTTEQTFDYIKCMITDEEFDPNVVYGLNREQIEAINAYISAPMTATSFGDNKKSPSNKIITSELMYYWMVALQIPFECQYWHVARLLTLIRVCDEENNPKKMSRGDIMKRNASLNAARRKQLHSKG